MVPLSGSHLRATETVGDTMADTNKPASYGHDQKAAGGETKHAGKPGVAHNAPADKVEGKANGKGKTVKFTLDGNRG